MADPHIPTDETRSKVKALTVAGIVQDDICKVIGITKPTLHKHYRRELDCALAETTANVAHTLVQKALNGDTACAIFYLKAKGGWSERIRAEISGPDGGPVQTEDVTARDLLAERIARIAAGGASAGGDREPDA